MYSILVLSSTYIVNAKVEKVIEKAIFVTYILNTKELD